MLPVWAGVIPLTLIAGAPEPDPRLAAAFEPPVWTLDRRATKSP
jgi:hypothetical protein